jgi:Zn-dependent protease
MSDGQKIGRIHGIDVHVHWSWILVFLLATWNLAAGVFPDWHPNWSAGLDWAVALVAALMFFISVLAHEFAHSAVARARGLPTGSITLFLLGGVSRIHGEPPSPRTEFLIAIAGSLTSIGLGTILLALGMVGADVDQSFVRDPIRVFGQLSPVSTLLLWLGPVNLVLGVFNLLPAFPLDGGRILHSAFMGVHQERSNGHAVGCRRQVIAWLFVFGIAM